MPGYFEKKPPPNPKYSQYNFSNLKDVKTKDQMISIFSNFEKHIYQYYETNLSILHDKINDMQHEINELKRDNIRLKKRYQDNDLFD